jgi:hypothetical protein
LHGDVLAGQREFGCVYPQADWLGCSDDDRLCGEDAFEFIERGGSG